MRRSDRLFELIQVLRDGQLHRAADLAQVVGGVSVRTIWRDMATLMASGMPIEGERGVGYILRAPTTLPPILLAPHEMDALRQGLTLVALGDDPILARAARGLASKIGAVAPAPVASSTTDLFAFDGKATGEVGRHLPAIREAIQDKSILRIVYLSPEGDEMTHVIMPKSLDLGAPHWRLTGYCLDEGQDRVLRLDRILQIVPV